MKVKSSFCWYDFWIGVYIDVDKQLVYLCPLPMWVLCVSGLFKVDRTNDHFRWICGPITYGHSQEGKRRWMKYLWIGRLLIVKDRYGFDVSWC